MAAEASAVAANSPWPAPSGRRTRQSRAVEGSWRRAGSGTAWALSKHPGAPVLKIRLAPGGQVILSWPLSSTGFVLEQTSALGTTWMPTLRPILDTATEHTVTVPASGPLRCYRLRRAQP